MSTDSNTDSVKPRLVYLETTSDLLKEDNGELLDELFKDDVSTDWVWTAFDEENRYYGIVSQFGNTTVTRFEGDQETLIGSQANPVPFSKCSVDHEGLKNILRSWFDLSLLDGEMVCLCGYHYSDEDVPEYCVHCNERMRPRLVKLLREEIAGEGKGRSYKWSGADEHGYEVQITYSSNQLSIRMDELGRRFNLENMDAREILDEILMEFMSLVDFDTTRCGECDHICLEHEEECPKCHAPLD